METNLIIASAEVLDPAAQGRWTVEAVVAALPGGAPKADSESPVPFFHMLERLKTTKREGWRRFGIRQYELSSLQGNHVLVNAFLTLSQN
jgi:hypothetical protein